MSTVVTSCVGAGASLLALAAGFAVSIAAMIATREPREDYATVARSSVSLAAVAKRVESRKSWMRRVATRSRQRAAREAGQVIRYSARPDQCDLATSILDVALAEGHRDRLASPRALESEFIPGGEHRGARASPVCGTARYSRRSDARKLFNRREPAHRVRICDADPENVETCSSRSLQTRPVASTWRHRVSTHRTATSGL